MTRLVSICVLCGALVGACGHQESVQPQPTTTTTTTVVPETTTTTVAPVPTTVPTTTTRPRPATTTTVAEPVVQGEAVTTGSTVSLDDPDMAAWRAIARCEMPGPGGVPSEPWGVHWSFIGSRYSGSLGIYNPAWREHGGSKYGPTAGHATWQQQIEIARVIRDRHGYRAWGCAKKVGLA